MSIPNDIIGSANVSYLGDPFEQYCGLNGKPLIGGHIEVYLAGTSDKYMTLQDFDGDYNPFKVPLGADGRVVMLADPSLTYDIYVYNSYNDLVCSRLNVECTCPGNISIKGADTWVRNTDGTLDISLRTSANNRRVFDVNTRNKILDVQSPLYFVENSPSATIIGIQGGASGYITKDYVDSVVSGKLDTSAFSAVSGDFLTDKFEYDDNFNITGYDGSAFASNGQTYSAGTNIDITDNVISVTGLPTSSDVENAISSAVTNVENKFEYNTNNYITAYNNSAFAGTNYSAGDYVSIENDTISVTGLQPSGDYATHDDLTAYQPSGDYATNEDVESATSGKQDTLSAGDGISIVNNTISVTAQGGIEQVSHDDTLSGNGNSDPLGIANIEDFVKQNDLSAYQLSGNYLSASESANFYPMTGNPSGFLTNDAITGLQPSGDYATHDDLTAYATTALVSSVSSELYSAVSSISGDFELVAGSGVELVDDPNAKTTTINVTAEGGNKEVENLVTANSATWNTVSDKLDTTAFSDVSGSFLTAHQDLSDYATTASVAEKLDTTAFSDVSGSFLTAHQDISNKLDTTAFSDVSGSFLTAVPDTYLQNTDLTISEGKITEISGVPLSAGDELPSGTMNTSALEYNAVNEISGYNGSAIAQYGAEKQWLVHDDTLVHASNSAQYALGVNLSAVAQLLGVDETVLFESTNADGTTLTTASPITLAEDYSNFSRMRIEYRIWGDQSFKYILEEVPCRNGYFTLSHGYINGPTNPNFYEFLYGLSGNDSKLYYSLGRFNTMGQNGITTVDELNIMGVTGIGRKS